MQMHEDSGSNFLNLAAALKIILGWTIKDADIPRAKHLLHEYLIKFIKVRLVLAWNYLLTKASRFIQKMWSRRTIGWHIYLINCVIMGQCTDSGHSCLKGSTNYSRATLWTTMVQENLRLASSVHSRRIESFERWYVLSKLSMNQTHVASLAW